MIEQEILNLLADVPEILDEVSSEEFGERFYLGRIREGVSVPAIVAQGVGVDHDYGLGGERTAF